MAVRSVGIDSPSMRMGALFALVMALCGAARAGEMRTYDTPYYTIRTDLDPADAAEASLRMTRIFEEYQHKKFGFPGEIHEKFHCLLYRSRADYEAAGGPPKSTGVYLDDVKSLMVCTGDHPTPAVWGVLQHEAFHQFAAKVIRADLPQWLNEGIAEYFAECRFTGDGFFPGLARPQRIHRLQDEISDGKLKPTAELLRMTREQWSKGLTIKDYDQAWSIVYYLLHADDGKYAKSLDRYILLLGQKVHNETAWRQCFGDVGQFEARWKAWWQQVPEDLTADEAIEAQVQTFCSFLARTTIPRGGFPSFDAFAEAAGTSRPGVEVLPPALLAQAIQAAQDSGAKFAITQKPGELPKVEADLADGTCVTCWFISRGSKSPKISTDFDNVSVIVTRAAKLIGDGNRDIARTMLQTALRMHPKSADADAARKLLKQTNP
jgi:hypothetical protein